MKMGTTDTRCVSSREHDTRLFSAAAAMFFALLLLSWGFALPAYAAQSATTTYQTSSAANNVVTAKSATTTGKAANNSSVSTTLSAGSINETAEEKAAAEKKAKEEAAKQAAAYDLNTRVYKTRLPTGIYTIQKASAKSKVLDVAHDGLKPGSNIYLYGNDNSGSQAWYISYDKRGLYTIVGIQSNLALSVKGAGKANGTNVQLAAKNSKSTAQRFIIEKSGNGYIITPLYTKAYGVNDMSITVNGNKNSNKTNIQVSKTTKGASQVFSFNKVNARYDKPEILANLIVNSARRGDTYVDAERYMFSEKTLNAVNSISAEWHTRDMYADNVFCFSPGVLKSTTTAKKNGKTVKTTTFSMRYFNLNYRKPVSTIKKQEAAVEKATKTVVANVKKMNKTDAAIYLHDWLAKNTRYSSKTSVGTGLTVYEAIVCRGAVCGGYAKAYKYLCSKAGIKCNYVLGEVDWGAGYPDHAWNSVVLNGKTLYVDVCWDRSTDKQAKRTYCLKSKAFFTKNSHVFI